MRCSTSSGEYPTAAELICTCTQCQEQRPISSRVRFQVPNAAFAKDTTMTSQRWGIEKARIASIMLSPPGSDALFPDTVEGRCLSRENDAVALASGPRRRRRRRCRIADLAGFVEATGLSQSTSNHLRCLSECGLVSAEQHGCSIHYSLTDNRIEPLPGEHGSRSGTHKSRVPPRVRP